MLTASQQKKGRDALLHRAVSKRPLAWLATTTENQDVRYYVSPEVDQMWLPLPQGYNKKVALGQVDLVCKEAIFRKAQPGWARKMLKSHTECRLNFRSLSSHHLLGAILSLGSFLELNAFSLIFPYRNPSIYLPFLPFPRPLLHQIVGGAQFGRTCFPSRLGRAHSCKESPLNEAVGWKQLPL